jgi:hypothetical protein
MRKNVLWSPQGLGADDRAGVFAIIQVLKANLRPHIIFTTDEEVGGVGAMMLAEKKCPFEDLRYMIELDRRGTNDCVFYQCDNEDFTKYVEQFGFIEAFGTFSDICELSPAWKVAGVNLSIGYQNEHSVSETLHVNAMLATIEKVKKMLQEPVDEIPFFNFVPAVYSYRGGAKYWDNWYGDYYGWDSGCYTTGSIAKLAAKAAEADDTKTFNVNEDQDIAYCMGCGKPFYEEDMIPAVAEDGLIEYFCTDCLCNKVQTDWCVDCESLYIKSYSGQHKCVLCEKEDLNSNGAV